METKTSQNPLKTQVDFYQYYYHHILSSEYEPEQREAIERDLKSPLPYSDLNKVALNNVVTQVFIRKVIDTAEEKYDAIQEKINKEKSK